MAPAQAAPNPPEVSPSHFPPPPPPVFRTEVRPWESDGLVALLQHEAHQLQIKVSHGLTLAVSADAAHIEVHRLFSLETQEMDPHLSSDSLNSLFH